MRYARAYLWVSALVFVLIGLNTFRDPVAATAGLELVPRSISAFNEVRANYGGLQIGIGLLLLVGAWKTASTTHALWVAVAISGGLVAGRLVSVVLDGLPSPVLLSLLALESVATVLALFFLWLDPG